MVLLSSPFLVQLYKSFASAIMATEGIIRNRHALPPSIIAQNALANSTAIETRESLTRIPRAPAPTYTDTSDYFDSYSDCGSVDSVDSMPTFLHAHIEEFEMRPSSDSVYLLGEPESALFRSNIFTHGPIGEVKQINDEAGDSRLYYESKMRKAEDEKKRKLSDQIFGGVRKVKQRLMSVFRKSQRKDSALEDSPDSANEDALASDEEPLTAVLEPEIMPRQSSLDSEDTSPFPALSMSPTAEAVFHDYTISQGNPPNTATTVQSAADQRRPTSSDSMRRSPTTSLDQTPEQVAEIALKINQKLQAVGNLTEEERQRRFSNAYGYNTTEVRQRKASAALCKIVSKEQQKKAEPHEKILAKHLKQEGRKQRRATTSNDAGPSQSVSSPSPISDDGEIKRRDFAALLNVAGSALQRSQTAMP